jgi:MazG family protein
MARLRDPEGGCPWDREQTFETILPHTIEEAYEVADAIERGDMKELRDELGDLLFQVVFYAQMAAEAGHFGFDDIVAGICEKMLRRHPHVFAEEVIEDAEQQTRAWEQLKARERAQKSEHSKAAHLDGVARALPALIRSAKLQRRAAQVGFDWPHVQDVVHKIEEELEEVREELKQEINQQRVEEEIGDLLFACVNLARHTGVDPEAALRGANGKFERRFLSIEQTLAARGSSLQEATLDEMDQLWEKAKEQERLD